MLSYALEGALLAEHVSLWHESVVLLTASGRRAQGDCVPRLWLRQSGCSHVFFDVKKIKLTLLAVRQQVGAADRTKLYNALCVYVQKDWRCVA